MEFNKLQNYFFFGLLLVITGLVFWLLYPYFFALFWATVLALIFYPVKQWLKAKVRGDGRAALITLALICLVFLIPAFFIGSIIIQQSISVYDQFANVEAYTKVSAIIENNLAHPWVSKWLGQIDVKTKLIQASSAISGWLYQVAASGGQSALALAIQILVLFYALFYFLRDGEMILKKLMYLLPLGDENEKILFSRFVSTVRATLKGTVVIGIAQGLIGGLAFMIVGVPGSAFWTMLMVVLSIIPNIGAGLILIPTILVYIILGKWWAVAVLVIATFLINIIDNILRGPLVGKDIQMHSLWIFFATLGGLGAFGISGIIIGPVLVAFALNVWEMYSRKYKTQLEQAD